MTHETSFRTFFPAKKDTKRHTKHLVSGSMCYPRHLDGIPKKWPFSCQSPINDLLLKSNCFDWRRVDQFNIETDCMNKIPNLMDSPEQFANVLHSAFIFREAFLTVSWSSWYQPTWVKSVVWLSNEISSRNTTSFMAWIGFKPRLFLLEEIGLTYSSCLLIT